VVLVGHSGAGPLLPQVAQTQRAAGRAVGGYLFLDAGLPRPGATRLDLLDAEDRDMAAAFRAHLEAGGVFPDWSDEDLLPTLPLADQRTTVLAGLRPRPLAFFTEVLPHPDDWPDAPCGYLRTSESYVHWARVATLRGWAVETHRAEDPVGHFAALRDPTALAAATAHLLAQM
jgi:thioesterase domain-containing protein